MEYLVLRNSPPRQAKPRAADSIRSGTILLKGKLLETFLQNAKYESVRVFGGKPGNYWTAEAYRKYAYRKAGMVGTCSFGKVADTTVPRMYFSKPVVSKNDLPFNVTERYDY